MKKFFPIIIFLLASLQGYSQIINTFAGIYPTGSYSGDGGSATAAHLYLPAGLTTDRKGNLYIADAENYCIRKVNTSGIITNYAGTPTVYGFGGDSGPATAALISINDIACDPIGNIYFIDIGSNRIRKIDTFGIITTIAGTGSAGYSPDGTPATAATIGGHTGCGMGNAGIATDKYGNIYFADSCHLRVRKIDTAGILHTVAGGGVGTTYCCDGMPATDASCPLEGITVDNIGNIFMGSNARLLKVDTLGIIRTIAGNGTLGDAGPATASEVYEVSQIIADGADNIYFGEDLGSRVRKISNTGIITTIAGTGVWGYSGDGGSATNAEMHFVRGVAMDNAGNLFLSDVENNIVRYMPLPDKSPVFDSGHFQTLSLCENAPAYPINVLMAVIDSDTAQTDTWSVVRIPSHGTLVANYSMPTTGGLLTPVGMSYTPATGFIGHDTFRVRVTDGIRSDTTTVYVIVNPMPHADVISGSKNVCVGSTTSLTDTAAGGSWLVANDSASVSSTGVVTGVLPGTDIVYYIVSNSCGADTASWVMAIYALPSPGVISGKDTVCAGTNDTLAETVAGTWAIANTHANIIDTGIIKGFTAGEDTMIYNVTNMEGCAAKTTYPVYIAPNPAPGAITGKDTLCYGKKDTLTETVTGTWTVTNTRATINDTGVITPVNPGADTVLYRVTNTEGCIAKTTFPIYIETKTHCDSINEVYSVAGNTNYLEVYPNPANSVINIQYFPNFGDDAVFIVTDLLGREVAKTHIKANENSATINCATWARGMYLYRVVQGVYVAGAGKVAVE